MQVLPEPYLGAEGSWSRVQLYAPAVIVLIFLMYVYKYVQELKVMYTVKKERTVQIQGEIIVSSTGPAVSQ